MLHVDYSGVWNFVSPIQWRVIIIPSDRYLYGTLQTYDTSP